MIKMAFEKEVMECGNQIVVIILNTKRSLKNSIAVKAKGLKTLAADAKSGQM